MPRTRHAVARVLIAPIRMDDEPLHRNLEGHWPAGQHAPKGGIARYRAGAGAGVDGWGDGATAGEAVQIRRACFTCLKHFDELRPNCGVMTRTCDNACSSSRRPYIQQRFSQYGVRKVFVLSRSTEYWYGMFTGDGVRSMSGGVLRGSVMATARDVTAGRDVT